MASSKSKPVCMRRLAQLLEEQQEPFTPEIYLSERRQANKSMSSESNGCKAELLAKNLNRSCKQRRARVPNGSRILKLAINKLISCQNCWGIVCSKHKAQKDRGTHASGMAKKRQHNDKGNWSSPSSSTTLMHSSSKNYANVHFPCPEQNPGLPSRITFPGLKVHNLKELEVSTNTKLPWEYMQERKQLSPVSVREELPAEEGSPAKQEQTRPPFSFIRPRKTKVGCILSAYLCELLVQSVIEKQNCVDKIELKDVISGSPRYLKCKLVSMKTKQLLFDHVTELIKTSGMQRGRRSIRDVSGIEESGKVICEKICSWRQMLNQLVDLDISATTEEWRNFQLMNKIIGIEIANDILDDVVTETITFEVYHY